MIVPLSRVSAWVYRRAAKPVLFRLAPDGVHERMIRSASFVQSVPGLRAVPSWLWAYANRPVLGQTIQGIDFPNPIGLSAGLDKNAQILPMVQRIGFGFATVGSVTFHASTGNPRPWYHRLPKSRSLVVNAGLPNHGAATILQRIEGFSSGVFSSFPLVVSVAKTNSPATCTDNSGIADYIGALRLVAKAPRVRVCEINISCPNAYGGEPFTTPRRLDKLLTAIDALPELHRSRNKAIWVKMPINLPWAEFDALLRVIRQHRVDGVVIGNLNKDRSTASLADTLDPNVPGNLSGKPNEPLVNELISRTYQHYAGQLTIVGVGGVFSAADAYKKIRLGANLIDLITGLIFEGPQLIGTINRELVGLLRRDGYRTIAEAVGAAHREPPTSPNQ